MAESENRIISILKKENGVENDSATLVVLVREASFIFSIYSVLMGVILLLDKQPMIWYGLYFAAAVLFLILFKRSFNAPVQPIFYCMTALLILGGLLPAILFGWNLGFVNVNYCALLMLLFNSKLGLVQKRWICVGFFALSLALPGLRALWSGAAFGSELIHTSQAIQIYLLNNLILLGGICALGLTFASVSQEAEHRLFLYNEKLQAIADTDPLTGLMNRRSMKRKLGEIASNYAKSNEVVTVAIGDIDLFKHVNDTYGHDAGDLVLREIGALIRDYMEEFGYASRWGGEEFLFVFRGINGDHAFEYLERLRLKIMNTQFAYKDQVIPIQMTFGVSEYNSDPDFEMTIKDADEKLYIGKQSGRNRVVF